MNDFLGLHLMYQFPGTLSKIHLLQLGNLVTMFSFKLQWNLSTFRAAVNRSCLMSIFRGWVLCTVGGKSFPAPSLQCEQCTNPTGFQWTMCAIEAKHQRLMPGTIQTTSVLMLWYSDLKIFVCVCVCVIFVWSFIFFTKKNDWKWSENHFNPLFYFYAVSLCGHTN